MKRHTKKRISGRPSNHCRTVTIQITVTRQIAGALDLLTDTGLFGANRAAAAERIMSEQIRALLRDGLIAKTKKAME